MDTAWQIYGDIVGGWRTDGARVFDDKKVAVLVSRWRDKYSYILYKNGDTLWAEKWWRYSDARERLMSLTELPEQIQYLRVLS